MELEVQLSFFHVSCFFNVFLNEILPSPDYILKIQLYSKKFFNSAFYICASNPPGVYLICDGKLGKEPNCVCFSA